MKRSVGGSILAALGLIVLSFIHMPPVLAGTYGSINGTVTEASTHAPLANVQVTALAPTGKYRSTTDARGFYTITGIAPDTFAVSFELAGYESQIVPGVGVFADEQTRTDAQLRRPLKTIGEVRTRSVGGAFQPGTTADSYTVTKAQIANVLGNDLNSSEGKLLTSLPGVSSTRSGLPIIRGGKGNSINYQVEGIPFSDAWSNQATSLRLSPASLSELQLTPGVGSASYGNSGTGTVNALARRGTYGDGLSAEMGFGGPHFFHPLSLSYGFATLDNRWSDYATFFGSSLGPKWGGPNAPPAYLIGQEGAISLSNDRHVTNNLVYRFGHDQHQSAQLYVDLQVLGSGYGYGGGWQMQCYNTCGGVGINNYGLDPASTGISEQQLCNLTYFYLDQTSCNQSLPRPFSVTQPHKAYKIGYTNTLNSSTFLNASYYRDDALLTFDFIPDTFIPIGGANHGVTLDVTKQLSPKNLLQGGGLFNAELPYLHTFNPFQGASYTYYSNNTETYDFIPLNQCPAQATGTGGTPDCGYLSQYFPGGIPKIPPEYRSANLHRHEYAFYVNDTWTPNARLKADVGLRYEGAHLYHPAVYDLTTCTFTYQPLTWDTTNFDTTKPIGGANCPKATFPDLSGVWDPHFLEPRIAMSYRMGDNDSVRLSFGRSIRLPRDNAFENDSNFDYQDYAPGFSKIPSHWFDYGGTYPAPWGPGPYANAAQCGAANLNHDNLHYEVPCINYAEELAWDNASAGGNAGVLSPLVPETFTNYDLSYGHQFSRGPLRGVSFRVTPWYRRGYNSESRYAGPATNASGKPLFNPNGTVKNLPIALDASIGQDYADGGELLVTKDNPHGISGFFSATYTNSFSTAGDVYGGTISPTGFLLGTPYARINYISPFYSTLAISYTTRSGWRINPYVHYNVGYPRGAGLYTPAIYGGVANYVPVTNVTGIPVAYVDPANPGSALHPNIIATTGTDEGRYRYGALSHPYSTTDLTIEHASKRGDVIGFTIADVFNTTLWQGPQANYYNWQPIATGISGPYSGVNPNSYLFPQQFANTPYKYGGNMPYYNYPQNEGRTWYVYYRIKRI